MQIKIINNMGYIQKGAIGLGFGAWGRAWELRWMFQLNDYPTYLPIDEWFALTADPIDVNLVKYALNP